MEVPLLYRQWHDSRLHDVGNGCERLISGRQICGASQKWTLRSLNRPFSRRLDFEKQIALRGKEVSTSKNCKGPGKGVARNWKTLSVIEKRRGVGSNSSGDRGKHPKMGRYMEEASRNETLPRKGVHFLAALRRRSGFREGPYNERGRNRMFRPSVARGRRPPRPPPS